MSTDLGEGFRGPDGRVGYLLRQAHQAFRGAVAEALAPIGITGPQYSLLSVARRRSGLSGAELARDSMLTAQSTNQIVTALEHAGWVERRRDADDRRLLRIHVTAAGEEVVARASEAVGRVEDRMVAHLEADDRATFRRWLVDAAVRAGADPVAGDPPGPSAH